MSNPDPLCHRIWSKLTALRCNLQVFEESLADRRFLAEEAPALLHESVMSIETLIQDFKTLEKSLSQP